MVIRLRYGIKGRCDRRTTSTGEHAWCTYHANQPLTPSLRRIGRQQSARWVRSGAQPGHDRAPVLPTATDSNGDSNGSSQRQPSAARSTQGPSYVNAPPWVMSGLKNGRSLDGIAPPRTWPTHYGRLLRDAPERPSTANDRHRQQAANMKLLMVSWRTWRGLRPIGAAHTVEYGLALLIDKAGEQLLRVPEDKCPGKDLRGCVQCAEAGDELAAHEQQAEEGGDRASRELEGGERNGQTEPFGRPFDTADGCGSCYGSCGEPDEFNHEEVKWFGGRLDYIVDVCHLYTILSWLTDRNERFGLVGRAHDCHYAALLGGEAHGDQGRTEKARDRHSDRQQCHKYGRNDHDVLEAAQTYVLA